MVAVFETLPWNPALRGERAQFSAPPEVADPGRQGRIGRIARGNPTLAVLPVIGIEVSPTAFPRVGVSRAATVPRPREVR